MKEFNKGMAFISYVLFAVNGILSVFSIVNGNIELGVTQILTALIELIVAIYCTLEAKDG